MTSQSEVLRKRTKAFAIRIVNLFKSLPRTEEARVIGKQLLRSGTSVAANYRAVCRSRSKAEFVAKIGIVVEEADETVFWLELLSDVGVVAAARIMRYCRKQTSCWLFSQHHNERHVQIEISAPMFQ